jgi:DNA-binding CsgD family transcriptional regulator
MVQACSVRDANALMTTALMDTRGGGRIVLGHPPGDAALNAILTEQSSARMIALPATHTRPGRVAHVVPLIGTARDIFTGSLSLLVMHVASGTQAQPDVALLRALFDLSPAEARLTAALASGRKLAHSAAGCSIRLSTARSYLEAIFRKTGVHKRSELVALIAGNFGKILSHTTDTGICQ